MVQARSGFVRLMCAAAVLAACAAADAQPARTAGAKGGMTLAWSTLFGGPRPCVVRGLATDADGSVYLTGSAGGPDFPTTPGAYQRAFGGGRTNAFLAKVDSDGRLAWCTLFGGEGEGDCWASSVALDRQGNVYIAGRTNPGLPVTAAAFQPKFRGVNTDRGPSEPRSASGSPGGGDQNGFIAKFTGDGAHLLWASYVGTGASVSDISVDPNGDVYAATAFDPAAGGAPPSSEWFAGGFQRKPEKGDNVYLVKIRSDGTRVLAATYLTAPGGRTGPCALARSPAGEVYAAFSTTAAKLPTQHGFDPTFHGESDLYLAKLSADLSTLAFGTYIGGQTEESATGHHLAVDAEGNAWVAIATDSDGLATPRGALQRLPSWKKGTTIYVAKVSADGSKLLGATYFGGRNGDYGCEGLAVNRDGSFVIAFTTASPDVRVTTDAFQFAPSGAGADVFLAKISADFSTMIYGTYLGGAGTKGAAWNEARSLVLDPCGNVYLAGDTSCADFPTREAERDVLSGAEDGFLAKFLPAGIPPIKLRTNSAEYPAPAEVVMLATPEPGAGTIERVDFYANGKLLGSQNEAPWRFTWKDAPAGGWCVQAVARGDLGASSPSNVVTIAVAGNQNLPPTIVTPAAARPNPVDCLRENNLAEPVDMRAIAALTVVAADDQGEEALTYTWRVVSKPPGAADPAFSVNASNEAKKTLVRFSAAGDYTFEVAVQDATERISLSSVKVVVLSVR